MGGRSYKKVTVRPRRSDLRGLSDEQLEERIQTLRAPTIAALAKKAGPALKEFYRRRGNIPKKPPPLSKEKARQWREAVKWVRRVDRNVFDDYFLRALYQAEEGLAAMGIGRAALRDAHMTVNGTSVNPFNYARACRVLKGSVHENPKAWFFAEMATLAKVGMRAKSFDVEEKLMRELERYLEPGRARKQGAAGRKKRQQLDEPAREMFRAVCRDYEATAGKSFPAGGAIDHLLQLYHDGTLKKFRPREITGFGFPRNSHFKVEFSDGHEKKWLLMTLQKNWVSEYRKGKFSL